MIIWMIFAGQFKVGDIGGSRRSSVRSRPCPCGPCASPLRGAFQTRRLLGGSRGRRRFGEEPRSRPGKAAERNGTAVPPPPPTEKTTNHGFGNRFMDEFGFSRLAAGGQGVQERFWTRKHRKARGDLSKAPCESFQGQVLSDLRLVDQHISEAPAAGSAALHGPARPDSSCAASRRWLTSKSVSRCRERSRTRVD